nr:hypothetical protein [Tanacetum cinerariifolium]
MVLYSTLLMDDVLRGTHYSEYPPQRKKMCLSGSVLLRLRLGAVAKAKQETSTTPPIISSAAPVVETTLVASPTRLCGLVPNWDSYSDSPDEMDSPKHITLVARRCVSPRSSNHHLSSSSPYSGSTPVHSSRSPADSVPSSTPVTGSLALTRADLLPPRNRYRDSYSPKTSMVVDTEIDTTETEDGREMAIVDGDVVRDQVKVDPRDDKEEFEAIGGDSSSLSGTRDGTVRQLEADKMIASGERAGMAKSIRSLRLENLKRSLRRLDSFAERRLGFRP